MDAPLLIEGRNWFRPHIFSMGCVDRAIGDVWVDRAQYILNQVAAIVDLSHDPVSVKELITLHCLFGPGIRRHPPGTILQNIAMAVCAQTCDDDSRLAGVFAAAHSRGYGHPG